MWSIDINHCGSYCAQCQVFSDNEFNCNGETLEEVKAVVYGIRTKAWEDQAPMLKQLCELRQKQASSVAISQDVNIVSLCRTAVSKHVAEANFELNTELIVGGVMGSLELDCAKLESLAQEMPNANI